ncbi:hypothetical protein V6N13_141986 [Hibiscus sabdariffa]
MDVSKGMEIDDHPSFLPKSDKGSDGPPQTSYARVVSGSGRQVVNDPVPSLDDVVVEAGNVLVDTTSTFPSSTTEPRGERVSDVFAYVLKVSENEVYEPWMITNTRRRQPCSGNAKDGATDSLSLLSDPVVPGKGGLLIEVPVVHVGANGVRMASDGVALREVNTNTQDTVQVISSGGGLAPQRRQRLASNDGKQPLARKSSGAGLSLRLKVRRGKENKNLACPVLDHAGVASPGICSIENSIPVVPRGVEGGGI